MDRVGRDTVQREGRRLIVHSAREMPDWQARRFRRTRVVVGGQPFFVADAGRGADRRHRYVLEPWPDELADRPSRTIVYDDEYVALRDGGRLHAWMGLLLWPLQTLAAPLLGCLWHQTKRALEAPLALEARRATRQSIFAQYGIALALAAFSWPLAIHGAIAPVSPFTTAGAAIVLLIDAAMRYEHLQNHPEDLLGCFEWLARLRG